jgi:uncharacterized protein
MHPNKILVDSSFLFALYNIADIHNKKANTITEFYAGQFIIPYVVLTESAYLFRRAGGTSAVRQFLDALIKANYHYEPVYPDDLVRARDIMGQYADANLDFVDCCIMALSERLNITQVCTFDHRDFNIFRPKHVSHLEILP